MKKLIFVLILLTFTSLVNGQWGMDLRLTNDPGYSHTGWSKPLIAANGYMVHVVWYDDRNGNSEIYYKRSTDGGINWGIDSRLTNAAGESSSPSIAVSGQNIHISWNDARDGNREIYYKRSTDGGTNWGTDTRLTNASGESASPSLIISGSSVHIVWFDNRDGNHEIYYKRSTDGGTTWGSDTRLTNASGESQYPSIAVSGQVLHLCWNDMRDGNYEIYYKKSIDGGTSWGTDTRLTNNSAYSNISSISVSGEFVHVVWGDLREPNEEIYYKRSIDGGITWGADTRLTNSSGTSTIPAINVSGSFVHFVWMDNRTGNYEIYYKRSIDGGVNWETDTRLTYANANSDNMCPTISISGSIVQVLWSDNRNGNYEIYYIRNPIGNPVNLWETDVRLTNDPANSSLSLNNAWSIAANGNNLHVTWNDSRDGNNEIYYKRSPDGGISWGTDIRLTNNAASSVLSSITVSGSVLHVIWSDSRDGNQEIYYKNSPDGGVSWGTDTRLTNASNISHRPSSASSGSSVYIAWSDERDGNSEIYYKRSLDGGVSWGIDLRLTNNSGYSDCPSIAVSGQVVHVLWLDDRDGNREIYYKRSTDGGTNWEADVRLTNNSALSNVGSICVAEQIVHVLWYDERDGNPEIYYKRSTNAGISWGTDTRLTNAAGNSAAPNVAVSGTSVHVVFEEQRDGNPEIYYKLSTNSGLSWQTETRLTNASGNSFFPFIAITGSILNIVWYDNRDGNNEIYYKRNPAGNPIGINNISTEVPKEFSLSQNYPNPFNPTTKIQFKVASSKFIKLTVFDLLGKEIEALVNEKLQPGTYEVDWNGSDYSSGVYFYRLTTEDFSETKRMILIK